MILALVSLRDAFHVLAWGACVALFGCFVTRRPPGPPRRKRHI